MREIGALLDLVEQGEGAVITRGGWAVARRVPSAPAWDMAAATSAVEEAGLALIRAG